MRKPSTFLASRHRDGAALVEYGLTITAMSIVALTISTLLNPAVDEGACNLKNTYATETCVHYGAAPRLGFDPTPDAFSIPSVTGADRASVVTSGPVTVTGLSDRNIVQVTGPGAPQISIEGRPWGRSGFVGEGESLRVRLLSADTASTDRTATLTIGERQTTFTVRTR